jgi:hypothetical protein
VLARWGSCERSATLREEAKALADSFKQMGAPAPAAALGALAGA